MNYTLMSVLALFCGKDWQQLKSLPLNTRIVGKDARARQKLFVLAICGRWQEHLLFIWLIFCAIGSNAALCCLIPTLKPPLSKC